MCLGITPVKGKVLYIVMPRELRSEPEVQGVNAPHSSVFPGMTTKEGPLL
jgi:hypothetical protein